MVASGLGAGDAGDGRAALPAPIAFSENAARIGLSREMLISRLRPFSALSRCWMVLFAQSCTVMVIAAHAIGGANAPDTTATALATPSAAEGGIALPQTIDAANRVFGPDCVLAQGTRRCTCPRHRLPRTSPRNTLSLTTVLPGNRQLGTAQVCPQFCAFPARRWR